MTMKQVKRMSARIHNAMKAENEKVAAALEVAAQEMVEMMEQEPVIDDLQTAAMEAEIAAELELPEAARKMWA